jgi:hypothetical protein
VALEQAEVVAARADAKAERQRAAREKAWAKRQTAADALLRAADVELARAFTAKGWKLENHCSNAKGDGPDILVFRTQNDMQVIVRMMTFTF